MNPVQSILETSRRIALCAAENAASELTVGTMTSTNTVRLSEDFELDEELLTFTPLCSDMVVEVPEGGNPSHNHAFAQALTDHTALDGTMLPVTFVPAGVNLPPYDPNNKEAYQQAIGNMIASGELIPSQVLNLNHDHGFKPDLPKIRLWRGVKEGDQVLVLKVNPRSYVVLCPLNKLGNEPNDGVRDYDPINA